MAKRIVLSDGNKVNSKGYKIDLTGIDFSRFNMNPVMLYNHKDDRVIGRWENLSITDNRLEADPVFDEADEVGAEIKRKYDNDFLRASSIGLIVYDAAYINDELIVTKSELIEASIVSIPADAGAVVLYNENKEVLSFEQLQLNFNNNHQQIQNQTEMQITLSQKTMDCLGLSGEITAKDVELEVLALKDKVTALEGAKVTDYLNQAEKDGKITAAEKATFQKLAQSDFDSVKTIIDAKPTTASASLADQVTKSDLSAGRETWDYLKWMKDDPDGLAKLKHDNPKEFERIKSTLKK